MNQILCCDWLTSGKDEDILPAGSAIKLMFFKSYNKPFVNQAIKARWLDIGLVLFVVVVVFCFCLLVFSISQNGTHNK